MNKYDLIAILIILVLFILIGINTYSNRNWSEDISCINWEQYGNLSCQDIINCNDIDSEKNAWIQECSCKDSNLTQKVICKEKVDIRRYKE